MKKIIVLMASLMMLIAFPVHTSAQEDEALYSIEMHRLYNPNSGEHFYTGSIEEKDFLVKAGWRYEGVGWIAPSRSDTPVYRLYNKYAGDHHYTTDTHERDVLISAGWTDEKIGWYSDDNMIQPLYRQYNPYAKAGSHNYTTDKNENDTLVSFGWKEEGISWWGSYPKALEFEEFFAFDTRLVAPKNLNMQVDTEVPGKNTVFYYSPEKEVWWMQVRIIPRNTLPSELNLKTDASLSAVLNALMTEDPYESSEVTSKGGYVRQAYSWHGTYDLYTVRGAFEKDNEIYIVTYTCESSEKAENEPIFNQCIAYFLFTS